jgi:hypothetical protein
MGCEKSGSIANDNGNNPYFIEAYLESGSYAIVHLFQTINITQPVDIYNTMSADSVARYYKQINARVLLYKDGVLVDSLTKLSCNGYSYMLYFETNFWYLQGNSHIIEPGGNYQMVVKIPSHPDMVASCKVPQRVDIQNIDTIVDNNYTDGFSIGLPNQKDSILIIHNYDFRLTFLDPANIQNFYTLECYYLEKKYTVYSKLTSWIESEFGPNPLFENKAGPVNDSRPFFSDKLFNGTQEVIDLEPTESDSLECINLVSISEGYYERLKSEDLYGANLNNAYATPVQMYSNFTNAVGYLAGRTVSSDTIKMKAFYKKNPFPYISKKTPL